MDNGIITIFNPTFTFFSLFGVFFSIVFFYLLNKHYSLAIRISLIGGSAFSLIASLIPSMTLVFAISFLPSFIYHHFNLLAVAPFLIGVMSFVGIWCIVVLVRELNFVFHVSHQSPQVATTIIAASVFVFIVHCMHAGIADYNIIVNSQRLSNYAANGSNPKQLERIYIEILHSSDQGLQNDLLADFAHNPHAPSELLRTIYLKTVESDLDSVSRKTILLNLSRNTQTPSDVLANVMLSLNQEKAVPMKDMTLAVIAHNPNFSQETLLQLTDYPDCEIRRAIISYPNISETVLNQIIKNDPDIGVRHDAKRRLDFLHGISHLETDSTSRPSRESTQPDPYPEQAKNSVDSQQLRQIYDAAELRENTSIILANLASNCFITDELAHKIYAKSTTLRSNFRTPILIALAANPRTPVDILDQLAGENELAILRALASNPHLPDALITKIAPYPDCKIRKKIICIPSITPAILTHLQKDIDESVALEANTRLNQTDSYLHTCRPIQKMNPSCQKYFGTTAAPDMQSYPNTSEAKPKSYYPIHNV